MDKLKVLYLEDSETDVELVSSLFEQEKIGHRIYHVTNKRDFLNTLHFSDIDVVLADYSQTSFSGPEALELVRQEFSDIPFIILSEIMGEEIAIELLKGGAADYILKQRMNRLIPAIRRALLENKERAKRLKEEDLRKKYDFIINTSKSMFSLVDRDYIYEAVNEAFCKAHNLVRDQVIGKSLEELWGKETFEKYIKDNFDQSFTNNVVRYQSWFNIPSHGLRCFEVTFYPYKENGSEVTHTVVDTMDITDQQKAKEALVESEARYRMLFNHAVEGIFLVKDNKIQACNNKVSEYFGYDKNKMLNTDPFFYSAPLQQDGIPSDEKIKTILNKSAEEDSVRFDWVYRKLNGQEFTADVSISSFRLEGETFYQYFIQDITEKLRTAETQRQLVTAIEQAAELVLITDVEGTFEYVNNAFLEASGFSNDEVLGRNLKLVLEDNTQNDQFTAVQQAIIEQNVWSGRVEMKTKSNRRRNLLVSVSPMRSEKGAILNYVIVARDITEESKIQTYLQQAQKMETIGTLAGGIAHDFNNILTTITGHSDIAMKELPEDSSVKDDLQQIMKAADRAKGLVRQILTFSRQVDQEDIKVDVAALILEILKLISASLPENIEVIQNLKDDCPPVSADPTHLHQVIMNICTNAIYAMKDKGGTLRITLDSLTIDSSSSDEYPNLKKGKHIMLIISDSGKGIEASAIDRIFEPFFTTKPVGEGTGLGLSVVHGIIRNLKGEIKVDSTPDKGTNFTILIPEIS